MKEIQKFLLKKFGIRDADWSDVAKIRFTRNYVASLEKDMYLQDVDWQKFWQEMAYNPNALIYQLCDTKQSLELIPFDFPAHNKKYVYEKGEKTVTSYFSQDEQLYFRKSRSYTYNERLTPQSVEIKFEWFDAGGNVVFETLRNVVFDSEIEKVKRRNSRLKTNYDFAITELGNSGQIAPENFFVLDSLLNQEKRFYVEGILQPLITKIQDTDFISQTSFLTESLRTKLVKDLTITPTNSQT